MSKFYFITKKNTFPPYIAYPKFLFDTKLPETAKLLYAVLLDRARLSSKNNGWSDDNGYVFVYFTISDMAKALGKGRTTVKTALSVLDKAGMIFRKRQGPGNANRLYVKLPEIRPTEIRPTGVAKPTSISPESRPCESPKTEPQMVGKQTGNNNIYSNNIYSNNNLVIRESNNGITPNNNNKDEASAYGCYGNVFLTASEYSDLAATIPDLKKYIDKLSCYMKSKGKYYANHAATIKEWWLGDNPTNKIRTYEYKEGESL